MTDGEMHRQGAGRVGGPPPPDDQPLRQRGHRAAEPAARAARRLAAGRHGGGVRALGGVTPRLGIRATATRPHTQRS